MGLKVADFLDKVRLKSKIPKNQIDDDQLLSLADDEIRSVLIPEIVSMNENFFLQEIEDSYGPDKTTFRNPSGSIGGGLQNLQARLQGNTDRFYNVDKINTEDKSKIRINYSYAYSTGGVNFSFYSTAGGFELYPKPSSRGTLVKYYLLRPGRLVPSSQTGVVVEVFEDTNQIELNQIPVEIQSGTQIDFMKSDRLNERTIVDATVSQADTGTQRITVSDIDYDKVSVGDTVSVSGTAPFWPVEEYGPKLVDLTCRRVAQIIGDQKLMNDCNMSLKGYGNLISESISPRVREEVDAIMVDW